MKLRTKTRMLSASEERALLDRYFDQGDQSAKDLLVRSYMPMAIRAAQVVASRGNVSQEDLCQEAIMALGEAIERFDRSRDIRISALSQIYIKAALMRYVMDNSSVVRVGTNFADKRVFMHLRREVSEIEAQTGRPLTDEGRQTIADRLGVSIKSVQRMEPRVFASDSTVSTTDTMTDEDGGMVLHFPGMIVPGEQGSVETELDCTRVMDTIQQSLNAHYSGRDLEIVQARIHGDQDRATLRRLSEKHQITVERIRQIQRDGLSVIRRTLEEQGIRSIQDIAV